MGRARLGRPGGLWPRAGAGPDAVNLSWRPGLIGVLPALVTPPLGAKEDTIRRVTVLSPDSAKMHVVMTWRDWAVTFLAKISPVYWRMPHGGRPEDDYMSLPVL